MTEQTYAVRLGNRLREVRRDRALTSADVQARTGGLITAATICAYERGDRAISAYKLSVLAEVYGASPATLVAIEVSTGTVRFPVDETPRDVRIDLHQLSTVAKAQAGPVVRYLTATRLTARTSPTTTVLDRREIRKLAVLLAITPGTLISSLAEWGILAGGRPISA